MWQFGPYRVEGLIARGGMGEILRAYDTRHDRVVALKLLAENLAADDEFRERFKREAHAAARLREPHVIPIHAYGEIDGRLYLDMRLVEGGDVGSLLASRGPMRPAEAVGVIEQVARALDAAHAEGLVHRDVKPSNILLGDGGFAYLVDFGIAHSVQAGTLTSTGFTVGTLDYMAPERFDDAPVDHRADVYSLACVLYQCLTGAKPFSGDTAASLINAHLNHQPPLPSSARSDVPREFDRIVARGMAKNPAERFSSAGELARAARQALTTMFPVSAPEPARRSRRWGFVVAGAGAVVVLGAGTALALTAMRTEAGSPVPAEPTAPRTSAPAPPQPVTSSTTSVPAPSPTALPSAPQLPPPAPPPSSQSPKPPGGTKQCRTIVFEGKERGVGCFDPNGDHLYAHDTARDGMWIRTYLATDYGRTEECKDLKSEGGPIDCKFDLSEQGKGRFQVELWDAKKRVAETPWTDYFPIAQ
ncbi:serine/threonine-protein kinase [Saccharopolyspora erythraea NRRL 2338]|uniref:non-specific serine/threonine protein kinase n=2 Tax=Saccharopolyspora erythraea TaxID=1836 RepID=A4FEJ2_SACEN|nr:serine/threonine-protein kinase [Saccharopolyspora erythraea]EQD81617.1 protein kinase [Saccharopolyspora erythraea D]PFG96192.1 serine/threonine-protein kinase [Saccharopolyspora erythraea NRRL 2338]QRK92724.1 protein kinase [Saccharopolyspora erythraea]CAM02467.1 putative serine/threonine-protein kinase [Saccharopolyspora erythraea NRRL 2338]